MAYSEKLSTITRIRVTGSFDNNDENVGSGMVGAPACGDVMKLQIKVNDEGIIEDARFKTYGCGSAIASSSPRHRMGEREVSTKRRRSKTPILLKNLNCRR